MQTFKRSVASSSLESVSSPRINAIAIFFSGLMRESKLAMSLRTGNALSTVLLQLLETLCTVA